MASYLSYALQLKQYEDDKVKAEIIRSKIQWAEKGVHSTKYFLGMEKHNKSKKHIRKFEIDKIIIKDSQKIQLHQKIYYEDLYKSNQDIDYTIPDKFFNSTMIPKLTDLEKSTCDQLLSLAECEDINLTFKNEKSPGNNGLGDEFYKQFWNELLECIYTCY